MTLMAKRFYSTTYFCSFANSFSSSAPKEQLVSGTIAARIEEIGTETGRGIGQEIRTEIETEIEIEIGARNEIGKEGKELFFMV